MGDRAVEEGGRNHADRAPGSTGATRRRPPCERGVRFPVPFRTAVTSGGGRRLSVAARKGIRRSAGHVSLSYRQVRETGDGARSTTHRHTTWGWSEEKVWKLLQ
jgi:hypothetical protein